MINLNLVKSIPNKEVRNDIVRVFYGIIPCDGKTRSLDSIKANEDKYRKLLDSKAKRDSIKRG